MLCYAVTMSYSLTRLSLSGTRRLLRSRNHHFLAPRRKTIRQIKSQYFRYLNSSSEKDVAKVYEDDDFESRSPYEDVDLDAIAGDDPDKIRALKTVLLELDMKRQQGEKVPTNLTIEKWHAVLKLDSAIKRNSLYHFYWLNENKKETNKRRQAEKHERYLEQKAAEPAERPKVTTSGPIMYRLDQNSLFFRILDPFMKLRYNLRLLYASMFNSHIVVDCGYEPYMVEKNLQICTKQMLLMWSDNRESPNPFHIIFCNLSPDSMMFRRFSERLLGSDAPDFPFFYTPEHYMDIYPKDRLVYLTPHCTEDLDRFNPEDIYIIGGFVDKCQAEPLSLAKAKKEGLRMKKFPLDRYLQWQRGIKSLTLNQCLAIMNDLKYTNGDWKYALKHVPYRKIRSESDNNEVDEVDLEKASIRGSARIIREQYRQNLVYNLLLKDTHKKKHTGDSSWKKKPIASET